MEQCIIAFSCYGLCILHAFDFKWDENFMLRNSRQTRGRERQIVLQWSNINEVKINHGNKTLELNEDLEYFLIRSSVVRLVKMHLDACASEWVAKLPEAYCTLTKQSGEPQHELLLMLQSGAYILKKHQHQKVHYCIQWFILKYSSDYTARHIKYIYMHSCTQSTRAGLKSDLKQYFNCDLQIYRSQLNKFPVINFNFDL